VYTVISHYINLTFEDLPQTSGTFEPTATSSASPSSSLANNATQTTFPIPVPPHGARDNTLPLGLGIGVGIPVILVMGYLIISVFRSAHAATVSDDHRKRRQAGGEPPVTSAAYKRLAKLCGCCRKSPPHELSGDHTEKGPVHELPG
jgi:hypothetical protein